MSESDWRFWQLIISAMAAVGTVGAVIVALYLARRSRRPQLRVRARLEEFTSEDLNSGRRVNVWVTNTGPLPVTLRGPAWKVGFLWKQVKSQPVPSDRYNDAFGKKLCFGDQVGYSLEESDFKERVVGQMDPKWSRGLFGIRPRVKVVVVTTTTGVKVDSVVDPDVRRLFFEAGEKEG